MLDWKIMSVLQAMLSLLFCSLEVASAGILIARQQIGFLVRAMAASLVVMGAFCSAVRAYNWGLPGVWWGESHIYMNPGGVNRIHVP